MKTKLFPALAGLCGLGFALLLMPSLVKPAQADPRRKHDFVVLQATPYYNSYGTGETTKYQFAGFSVYNYDGSDGAPKVDLPVGNHPYVTTNQLAPLLARLADEGFELSFTDGANYVLRR